jgi:hypothetical protein
MTPKEALEGIKQRINYSLHKPENVDTKERQQRRIDKSAKQISVIEKALTELEELKKRDKPMKWIDVVDDTGHYDKCPVCDYPSYNDLGHNHFCGKCGQRLEWSVTNGE